MMKCKKRNPREDAIQEGNEKSKKSPKKNCNREIQETATMLPEDR